MRKYTLRNDFHNTTATVIADGLSHIYNEVEIALTESQRRRCWQKLCGTNGCGCGDENGARGPQRTNDGKRIIICR